MQDFKNGFGTVVALPEIKPNQRWVVGCAYDWDEYGEFEVQDEREIRLVEVREGKPLSFWNPFSKREEVEKVVRSLNLGPMSMTLTDEIIREGAVKILAQIAKEQEAERAYIKAQALRDNRLTGTFLPLDQAAN